jgi:release factor glutamine methyltransferase
LTPGATVEVARRALATAFREAGLDTPQLDARILVGHALGVDHTMLAANAKRQLDAAETDVIAALAVRRIAREPIARIVGHKEFWGLTLRVTPATLVPRPETETVVEAALTAVDAAGLRNRMLRIADLGTGTGALLLALLSELPNASGVATDISPDALEIARDNALRLGLDNRTQLVACDFGAALFGKFDLVVSNPPYVRSGELAGLAPEVASDPPIALEGGPDGLACYRAVAADARRLLVPSGELVVELGAGQESLVTALFRAQGLATSRARTDLAGIPRALTARVATMAP